MLDEAGRRSFLSVWESCWSSSTFMISWRLAMVYVARSRDGTKADKVGRTVVTTVGNVGNAEEATEPNLVIHSPAERSPWE